MTDKNLKIFGNRLRQLREAKGLTQTGLAVALSQAHERVNPDHYLGLDGNLISKWERAFQDKGGRTWNPKRQYVIYLIEIFADQLDVIVARAWAKQAGHSLNEQDLRPIFPDISDWSQLEEASVEKPDDKIRQLEDFPEQHLFGIQEKQLRLQEAVTAEAEPWIVAIDGIGGIGKSTLANALARQIVLLERFQEVIWISAKQEEFLPSAGLQEIDQPALDANMLTDYLLEKLRGDQALPDSPRERQFLLTEILKKTAYFIVVDNLESVSDHEALLPVLRKLANPSKFLLTSRNNLYAHHDVFSVSLHEWVRKDVLAFLKHEAQSRGMTGLAQASDIQLEQIHNVVGGNPLALKLVIGQIYILPLTQVLKSLKEAEGKKTEDLYAYIYWQSWHSLTPISQQALLAMPMISLQGGTFDHLIRVSRLEPTQLGEALEALAALSLVEVTGDIETPRYRIHRLTETFLLKEVIKWTSSSR